MIIMIWMRFSRVDSGISNFWHEHERRFFSFFLLCFIYTLLNQWSPLLVKQKTQETNILKLTLVSMVLEKKFKLNTKKGFISFR